MNLKKQILILMTGSSLAQLIQLFSLPILSRIYSPQDYGELALLMAIAGLVSILSTLSYSESIIYAKNRSDAINILAICAFLGGGIFAILFVSVVAVSFFPYKVAQFGLGNWIYMIPFVAITAALNNIFFQWCNRKKEYKRIAYAKTLAVLFSVVLALGIGLAGGASGLLIGWIASLLVPAFMLMRILSNEAIINVVNLNDMSRLLKENIKYPKFVLPSEFIYILYNQFPVFLLTSVSSLSNVGLFNRARMLLNLPVAHIASQVALVFRQRAVEDYQKNGECKEIFIKTFRTLFLISILPYVLVMFTAPDVVAFVLGEKWRPVGDYITILGPMYYLNFLTSPLTNMYFISQRQKEDLHIFIFLLLTLGASCSLTFKLTSDVVVVLIVFSAVNTIFYIFKLFRSFQMACGLVL